MDGRRLWIGLLLCLTCAPSLHGETTKERRSAQAEGCTKVGSSSARTSDRLMRLKKRMRFYELDAIIITTDDEHQSEYVSEHDKRREYITGFTGSRGIAVVLEQNDSALWTDSRYYIQAEQDLDCNWLLMPEGRKGTPSITEWLSEKLPKKARVGADAKFISQEQWKIWSEELNKSEIQLLPSSTNLIDEIWIGLRPDEPSRKVFIHELKFAGKTWEDKVKRVRERMNETSVGGLLVTSLTEVAWLLNLRGFYTTYIPVFKAFVVITQSVVKLYIKKDILSQGVRQYLNEKKCHSTESPCIMVSIREYKDIYKDASIDFKGLKVLMPTSVSFALYSTQKTDLLKLGITPTLEEMVVKNPVEIKGMENAMLKDSVAFIAFVAKLEAEVKAGKAWDELKASQEIQNFRRQQADYRSESFETIAAVGPNAAMPHYNPSQKSKSTIDQNHIFLIDTGAQYLDGTTDITRTFHFGTPTDFQKEAYTRVLMGVISLASLVFPEGTLDSQVDVLTRQALFSYGLNYGHGTGHGIGSFLCVHEYPPSIGMASKSQDGYPLKPGMFFSIEPGFYQANEFGIRLETIFTVVEKKTPKNFENQTFYTFEPVVWIPFEKHMIKMSLLSQEQLKWLEHYNTKCVTLAGQRLRQSRHQQGLDWLMARAKPLKYWTNGAHSTPISFMLLFIVESIIIFNVK